MKVNYLSIGSVSMGIAGSTPNFDRFLPGIPGRARATSMSTVGDRRRIRLGIFDQEEFKRKMAWTEKMQDARRRGSGPRTPSLFVRKKDEVWEYVVRYHHLPRPDDRQPRPHRDGLEEAMGHNAAMSRRFQGQRRGPTSVRRRFLGGYLYHVVRLNGIREALRYQTTRHRNGGRFDALHAPADQPGAALPTCAPTGSPEAVESVPR